METENNSVTDEPESSGPGATLRAAREAKGLELSQIAAETRIPMRHLEAIEADRFDALPSRTYALGFSRNYARMVGLDENEMVELVRAEMGDAEMHQPAIAGGMEPGDPAKLPSPGLAWFGAIAAVLLAVGAIAFFTTYFGSGAGPASLLADGDDGSSEDGDTQQASAGEGAENPSAAPSATGQVVFTALDDGVWVRIYEEGGERLYEKLMDDGDRFVLPKTATEPRINTALPNLLAITIDGEAVPKLSEDPTVLDGTPVSAAALLARADETLAPDGTQAATN